MGGPDDEGAGCKTGKRDGEFTTVHRPGPSHSRNHDDRAARACSIFNSPAAAQTAMSVGMNGFEAPALQWHVAIMLLCSISGTGRPCPGSKKG